MNETKRRDFEKIIFGAFRGRPQNEIYVFYNGIPLFARARLKGDRYSFPLPKNLEEKMLSGQLIADFCYTDLPLSHFGQKQSDSPTSIVLSERFN